jgi:hypothetical protein
LADEKPVSDKLYQAEYLGSGTFVISKPKRKKAGAASGVHDPEQAFQRRLLQGKGSYETADKRCADHEGIHRRISTLSKSN